MQLITRVAALLVLAIVAPAAEALPVGGSAVTIDQMASLITAMPQGSWKDTGKTINQEMPISDLTSPAQPTNGFSFTATLRRRIAAP